MTVRELMEALREMPPTAIVVQRGYENGMNDINTPVLQTIYLRHNPDPWDGKYQQYYDSSDDETIAVILGHGGG